MSKLSFRNFIWPEDPETYRVEGIRQPVYVKTEAGNTVFSGLGPLKRTVSGSGIFTGPYAIDNYGELELQLYEGVAGTLTQINGETIHAYLTELSMELDEKSMFLRYRFTFREADRDGNIP